MQNRERIKLKRRYLIWLYKTTKECIDRIERKLTQLDIDRFILSELETQDATRELAEQIAKWDAYIHRKEQDTLSLKSEGKDVQKECRFLELKLRAVEKAIVRELGKKALADIQGMYESEMVARILASTDQT